MHIIGLCLLIYVLKGIKNHLMVYEKSSNDIQQPAGRLVAICSSGNHQTPPSGRISKRAIPPIVMTDIALVVGGAQSAGIENTCDCSTHGTVLVVIINPQPVTNWPIRYIVGADFDCIAAPTLKLFTKSVYYLVSSI